MFGIVAKKKNNDQQLKLTVDGLCPNPKFLTLM